MLSVRLKLMEWLDTKDRLVLLYSHRQPMSSSASPLLPTYATQFKAIRTDLPRILTGKYKAYCNFDIHSNQDHEDGSSRSHSSNNNHHLGGGGGVSLVRTGSFDELWLRPRMYCEFLHTIPPNDPLRHLRIWRDLGLDPFADRLVAVSIPLFINLQDDRTYLQQMELPLLGSWKKNCWIMFPFKSNAFKLSIMYSMEDRNHKLPDGFRVY
ncbi:hypothetical protein BCR42DRAFT_427267 [Absidia repens]|uniref:Uncharacterized protein n=1 Tax=Absidia repens TaxID=90262 RepID=A0A1X2I0A8_9FUNG|nr:hypothetical protein BCR42DRAFT_427267 [Absidia repens]